MKGKGKDAPPPSTQYCRKNKLHWKMRKLCMKGKMQGEKQQKATQKTEKMEE